MKSSDICLPKCGFDNCYHEAHGSDGGECLYERVLARDWLKVHCPEPEARVGEGVCRSVNQTQRGELLNEAVIYCYLLNY